MPLVEPLLQKKLWPFFVGILTLALFCIFAHSAWAAPSDYTGFTNAIFPNAPTGATENFNDKASSLIFGFFIGAMLTAALYLFFIWVVIHDRGQVFLMLLLVCLGINMASTNDLLMDLIGPQNPLMRHTLQNYSIILSYIFSIFFTYYFLDVDTHAPHLREWLFFMAALLLIALLYSAIDQRIVYFSLPSLGTLTIIVVLAAGVVTLHKEVSGSVTHIVAFTFFLLGGLADPLYNLGFITTSERANQITYAAYSLAAIMFAIVIAGQFATRQEEKESALEVSNERFALAARGSNEGLFDWDLLTDAVYFSGQFNKIIGLSLENETSSLKHWWRLIYAPDRGVVRDALRRFRRNPQAGAINVEYRIGSAGTRKRWLHTRAVATRDPHTGRILRLVGSIGDITARKQSEAALRASEARFRSITEAHPVPVLIVGLDYGHVRYASPGAELLLGLPSGTLMSHTLDRFLTKVEERQDIIDAMRENKEINLKEVTITKGDGDPLMAALSARRINYENAPAMVIGLYDLTEKKEAESKIAKQQEALQQSEKMAALGGLLAGVAHELNNPLSVVVGQATLLIEGSPEPKVTGRAEKIFKAADRCSRIVKSFLALARRKPPERKPVNLNTIINNSLDLLGYQFRNENIELNLDLDPNLPDVSGDGDQLTQVFTNLELNAVQAMLDWTGKKQVNIRTTTKGDDVLVIVSDTGPGIPQELRLRVFEPFFTTKSGKGGTGVGLSLCLNIIETHGGRLVLEETLEGGAIFRITMPKTVAVAETKTETPIDEPKAIKKLKILLVDDELELAQTLADLLEPEGHETVLAANGAIALEKLKAQKFDLIISDLRMPVLDGPGLYAEISKTMPAFLKRIIYVTGDTLSTHIQSFLGQVSVPVIEKPYRLVDVKRAVANLLNENAKQGNMP